jgi:hypothetical protein
MLNCLSYKVEAEIINPDASPLNSRKCVKPIARMNVSLLSPCIHPHLCLIHPIELVADLDI